MYDGVNWIKVYSVDYEAPSIEALPTNCPNCGAPLRDGKCEYCGTELFKI
jgi:ribosomal protein S27AE